MDSYEIRQYMLAILPIQFSVQSVMDQCLKQSLCVIFLLILVSISNLPVIKAENLCYLFYPLEFGFNLKLTSDESRYYVLAILPS